MSLRVIEELRSHGHQAYWVGGCVRDSLLNRPVKDRDVATSALPQQIVELFPHSRLVGARFGVVMVPDDDQLVEVATFRSDNEYIDGAASGKCHLFAGCHSGCPEAGFHNQWHVV